MVESKNKNCNESSGRQEREAALGRAIGDMAHYIKNILNGLEGGVYMVNTGLKRKREDLLNQGWGMVEKNVDQISDLALNMIAYSKRDRPEPESCSPEDLLQDVLDLQEGKALSKGVALTKVSGPGVGECLLDRKGLQRCLLNITAYAIECCAEAESGGARRIITMRVVRDEKFIGFDISAPIPDKMDPGAGETPFEAFLETVGSKGPGFGLFVAHDIMTSNKGKLTVQTEKKGETCFRLRLPLVLEGPH